MPDILPDIQGAAGFREATPIMVVGGDGLPVAASGASAKGAAL